MRQALTSAFYQVHRHQCHHWSTSVDRSGLVVSRSNSDISSGWEHVEIEDAQDAPEVEEGTCRELLCGLQVFFFGYGWNGWNGWNIGYHNVS
jgi:hypothetical protein